MKNYIKNTLLLSLLILFGSILLYSNVLIYPISCSDDEYILDIPLNTSATQVGSILDRETCINSSLFKIAIYLTFNQSNIKPGLYSLKGIRTLSDLIKIITSISNDRISFTIYEGWNINHIADALSSQMYINKDKFIDLSFDKNYIKSLGIAYEVNSLEGFLYPDTYTVLRTYNEKDLLSIFTKRFIDIYSLNIYPLTKKTKFSFQEILCLASIIQAEAMLVSEMPIISSVYQNRLSINKKLEADPTVLYYMNIDTLNLYKSDPYSKIGYNIFKDHKNRRNPYNTYMFKGLPPGPINNPSLSAMIAVMEPSDTSKFFIYFVADGSGGHVFSETLRDHKRAIKRIRSGN